MRTSKELFRLIKGVYGSEPRECPLCGAHTRFFAEIDVPAVFEYDAVCPQCGSLPRLRLLKLADDALGLFRETDRVLHFAPESPIKAFIESRVAEYVTADLFARDVALVLDIQAIDQPDQSWDVVLCSHVLEHVDHRRALAEIRRVLKPGGRLIAMFPIVDGWASHYEDASITSPRARVLHYGKDDHVRRFGAGVRQDIEAAGLALTTYVAFGPDVVRYGLLPGETVFIGTRPA